MSPVNKATHPMRPLSMSLRIAALALAAPLAWFALVRCSGGRAQENPPAAAPASPAAGSARTTDAAAIQVPVSAVIERTVPVYLEYVGTTDAIRSVTLEAEVTGY